MSATSAAASRLHALRFGDTKCFDLPREIERWTRKLICSMTERITSAARKLFPHGDAEGAGLAVLRLLKQKPEMSQRELSDLLGLSLGRTNFVLHALVDKGLVKAKNFRRSDNKLAYAYVLTPSGLGEKLRLTKAFLDRKEGEFEELRRIIAALKDELSDSAR